MFTIIFWIRKKYTNFVKNHSHEPHALDAKERLNPDIRWSGNGPQPQDRCIDANLGDFFFLIITGFSKNSLLSWKAA
jgi:hypothetical protein